MFRLSNSHLIEITLLTSLSLSACGDGNLSGNSSGTKSKSLGVSGAQFSGDRAAVPVEINKDDSDPLIAKDNNPSGNPTLGANPMQQSKLTPVPGAAGGLPADPGLGAAGINQIADPTLIPKKDPVVVTGGDGTIDSADWRIGEGLRKCLNGWGPKAPFTGSSPYRKISASISILSIGNSVNDTDVTDTPELVVLVAGVNLASSIRYRFLNPNGWYCIIADVNLATRLNVDLHTKAHLADSRVSVNILSATNNQTANVDVNVLSSVNVNRVNF